MTAAAPTVRVPPADGRAGRSPRWSPPLAGRATGGSRRGCSPPWAATRGCSAAGCRSPRRSCTAATCPGPDRELVTLRTAWRCGSWYEWGSTRSWRAGRPGGRRCRAGGRRRRRRLGPSPAPAARGDRRAARPPGGHRPHLGGAGGRAGRAPAHRAVPPRRPLRDAGDDAQQPGRRARGPRRWPGSPGRARRPRLRDGWWRPAGADQRRAPSVTAGGGRRRRRRPAPAETSSTSVPPALAPADAARATPRPRCGPAGRPAAPRSGPGRGRAWRPGRRGTRASAGWRRRGRRRRPPCRGRRAAAGHVAGARPRWLGPALDDRQRVAAPARTRRWPPGGASAPPRRRRPSGWRTGIAWIPRPPACQPQTMAAPAGAKGKPGARRRPGSASLATIRAWRIVPARRKPSATWRPVSMPQAPLATSKEKVPWPPAWGSSGLAPMSSWMSAARAGSPRLRSW